MRRQILVVMLLASCFSAFVLLVAPVMALASDDTEALATEAFDKHLAACPEHEIRCLWFLDGNLRIGMVMTFNLKDSTVTKGREVYDWAHQAYSTRALGVEQVAALKKIASDLPPEPAASKERAQQVLVAIHNGKAVQVKKYLRHELPSQITRIYDIGGDLIDAEPKTEEPSQEEQKEFNLRFGQDVSLILDPLSLPSDIEAAYAAFEHAIETPNEYSRLAGFLDSNPEAFAKLIEQYNQKASERLSSGNFDLASPSKSSGWTDYYHARTKRSSKFARQNAKTWKQGWGMTSKDAVERLSQSSPSTRRIAIEFLKAETDGDDFGFDWQSDPNAEDNAAAIKKWTGWLEKQPTPAKDDPKQTGRS